jgi:hypothetical protein
VLGLCVFDFAKAPITLLAIAVSLCLHQALLAHKVDVAAFAEPTGFLSWACGLVGALRAIPDIPTSIGLGTGTPMQTAQAEIDTAPVATGTRPSDGVLLIQVSRVLPSTTTTTTGHYVFFLLRVQFYHV